MVSRTHAYYVYNIYYIIIFKFEQLAPYKKRPAPVCSYEMDPVAGKLSDVTGSYRLSYVICGVMMTVSAVFFYVEPCVQRLQRKSQPPDGAGARPMEETVN